MGTIFFLYSCAAIVLMAVACSTSVAVWVISHRRAASWLVVLFAACGIELASVLLSEYTRSKEISSVMFESAAVNPLFGLVTSALFVISAWGWMLTRTYREPDRRRGAILAVVWVVVFALLSPSGGPDAALRQYIYWLWRDFALLGCASYGLWRTFRVEGESKRRDLKGLRGAAVVAVVGMLVVMAEDTFVILWYRPEMTGPAWSELAWYLSGRNITENLLMVVTAAWAIIANLRTFLVYFVHHPAAVAMRAESTEMTVDLSDRLALYSEKHELSVREREVLGLLLDGVDVQNTASRLFLSPATVRVHLHRIYGKVGVDGREHLVEDFWKG